MKDCAFVAENSSECVEIPLAGRLSLFNHRAPIWTCTTTKLTKDPELHRALSLDMFVCICWVNKGIYNWYNYNGFYRNAIFTGQLFLIIPKIYLSQTAEISEGKLLWWKYPHYWISICFEEREANHSRIRQNHVTTLAKNMRLSSMTDIFLQKLIHKLIQGLIIMVLCVMIFIGVDGYLCLVFAISNICPQPYNISSTTSQNLNVSCLVFAQSIEARC